MIVVTDNHAPRLRLASFDHARPAVADELEAGADAIVAAAKFSVEDGAIRGSGHIASLPGEPPNSDTGFLHDQGIHRGETAEVENTITISAVSDAPYSAFLELGTSRMAERPFMGPAATAERSAIVRSLAERLRVERGG